MKKRKKHKHKVLKAIKNGRNIKEIIKRIDSEPDINRPNKYGETPLYWAIRNHALEAVLILLKAGVNVNFKDSSGEMSLFWCIREHVPIEILTALLNAGANNVHLKNKAGNTPLSLARDLYPSVINILLEQDFNCARNTLLFSYPEIEHSEVPSVIREFLGLPKRPNKPGF